MKIPAELEKYGLEHARKPVERRLVLTAEAGPGCGKTHLFYATAPRPALVIQLDMNDRGLRERYVDDPDIVFMDVLVPPFVTHDEAQRKEDMKLWAKIREVFMAQADKRYFRSVMVDEGNALYQLARRSFLVNLDFGGEAQSSYAPINAGMARFYTLAKQKRFNLYIPHRQKDERVSGSSAPSGNKVYAGWKDALYESQCHVVLSKDADFDPTSCTNCGRPRARCKCTKFHKPNPADKFKCKIIKCTNNTNVEGMELTGEDITWQNIAMLVFPGSDEDEWK